MAKSPGLEWIIDRVREGVIILPMLKYPMNNGLGFKVLYATFNNISVISWRSVLLVEETGVSVKNHRPVANHWQTLSHLNRIHLALAGFELTTLVVISTDCIGSCKSNNHTITTGRKNMKAKTWKWEMILFLVNRSDFNILLAT